VLQAKHKNVLVNVW